MKKKIIVVDDDPHILALLKRAIEDRVPDVTVETCTSVKSAQGVFESAERVHLLVSDIVMPVETGWELIRWLKDQGKFKNLPVIAMSGYVSETEVSSEQKPGSLVCGFVAKPLNIDQLTKMIEDHVGVEPNAGPASDEKTTASEDS